MQRQSNPKRAAAQALRSLLDAGVTHVPKAKRATTAKPAAVVSKPAECKAEATAAPAVVMAPPAKTPANRHDALCSLAERVKQCQRCRELASTRTQTVFGVGNEQPRLVFMGEAPGADEDAQGEPFVGRAGQLLNKIIEACGMRRQDVYILNTLKCRPPNNRQPSPEEAANCREYLDAQLDLLQPEYICCLGATAAQSLLATAETIGRLRGRLHAYRGITVVCTYHPAYLLRSPDMKRHTWDDMKFLLGQMGLPVPK